MLTSNKKAGKKLKKGKSNYLNYGPNVSYNNDKYYYIYPKIAPKS